MDATVIKDLIVSAIANDAEIASWSSTNYGRGFLVYDGVDLDNLPGEENCPMVIVYNDELVQGSDQEDHVQRVITSCCIADTGKEIVGNVVKFAGCDMLEEFRKLVQNAVVPIRSGNIAFSQVEVDYQPIEQFPLFVAHMRFSITEPQTLPHSLLGT